MCTFSHMNYLIVMFLCFLENNSVIYLKYLRNYVI